MNRAAALFAAAALVGACRTAPYATPEVTDARVRLFPGGGAAAYLTIKGGKDRLLAASSPACEWMDLHETVDDGHVARMRSAPGGFELDPDEPLVLEPGGKHLMARCPAAEGSRAPLPITLRFELAGEIEVHARRVDTK